MRLFRNGTLSSYNVFVTLFSEVGIVVKHKGFTPKTTLSKQAYNFKVSIIRMYVLILQVR